MLSWRDVDACHFVFQVPDSWHHAVKSDDIVQLNVQIVSSYVVCPFYLNVLR